MILVNRISKIVSPSGVFSGYILTVFGCIAVYFSWTAIPLAGLGCAMAFSYSSSAIDVKAARYKTLLHLFGIIPIGGWMDIEDRDFFQMKHMKGAYATYSRSNRHSSISVNDYRVFLMRNADGKQITIARFDTHSDAQNFLDQLQSTLKFHTS